MKKTIVVAVAALVLGLGAFAVKALADSLTHGNTCCTVGAACCTSGAACCK